MLGRFVWAKLTKYIALSALSCIINYLINYTIDSLPYWLIAAVALCFCFFFFFFSDKFISLIAQLSP